MSENDLNTSHRFRIELDSENWLWFLDASGLELPAEGEPATPSPRSLPGLRKVGNVTFRRGISGSEQAADWTRSMRRKDIRVILLNEDGSDGYVWQLQRAWPIKHSESGEGITTLEIGYEQVTRPG